MPTLHYLLDAVKEALRQLNHSRETARDLVLTARLVSETARKTQQRTQELRRALWEQVDRAQSLRRHSGRTPF